MVDILAKLHSYVLTQTMIHEVDVDGEKHEVVNDEFHKILLGMWFM